ncbi:MAG: hypothetical protein K0Q79_1524 [Flavipsychrobacter sp.]|jgi:hypothetical protein|nr:hypothetical protein [Flavipsychrobacter sp.]
MYFCLEKGRRWRSKFKLCQNYKEKLKKQNKIQKNRNYKH